MDARSPGCGKRPFGSSLDKGGAFREFQGMIPPVMRRLGTLFLFAGLLFLTSCQASNPQEDLANLESLNAGFVFEIRYATPDNFTGEVLYPLPRAWMRRQPAEALVQVQKDLQKKGLGLKIFDAYRPLRVQHKMWNLIRDERYVSDPNKNAGRHTRGTAVDVTLVDASGKNLPMPSDYDDFSEKAHSDFARVTSEQAANRALLKEAMEKHGFTVLPTEWWHFDYAGWKNCPPMDIPLEQLEPPKP